MKILWLADEPGWAYDAIVQNVSWCLPQYEHEAFYMMQEHSWAEFVQLGIRITHADVVVSMHFKYFELIQPAGENVVIMLTGFRAL